MSWNVPLFACHAVAAKRRRRIVYPALLRTVHNDLAQPLTIGVVSSGFGIGPAFVYSRDKKFLVVGHDSYIDVIDVAEKTIVESLKLNGVFLSCYRYLAGTASS